MRRFEEIDLANPPAVILGSIMEPTWGAAREAIAEEAVLRMNEITASQPGMEEGYTPDPEIVEVMKRLPRYFQPVVTLMATMVPRYEESRLQENRGREALDQGTNMVLLVSIPFFLYFAK